jgi:hypothetical protein
MSDHDDVNRAIRRVARPHDSRYWDAADWDAHVEAVRSEVIAEEGAAARPPNGGFDPGARTPPPPPPPDMNARLRRAIGRRRAGWAGAYDETYRGVDDDLPPSAA